MDPEFGSVLSDAAFASKRDRCGVAYTEFFRQAAIRRREKTLTRLQMLAYTHVETVG
jgi:hypothetical protein